MPDHSVIEIARHMRNEAAQDPDACFNEAADAPAMPKVEKGR